MALLVLRIVLAVLLTVPTLVFLLSKCFFLARYPIGWLMWISSLFYDLVWKRTHAERGVTDGVMFILLAIGWAFVCPWAAALLVTLMGLAWGWTLLIDLRWRGGEMARQDPRYRGKVPLPLPRFILNVRGPVLERGKVCRLGVWPLGHEAAFEAITLNPSCVKPQFPMKLEILGDRGGLEILDLVTAERAAPDPEEMVRIPFRLRAARVAGPCELTIRLTCGGYSTSECLRLDAVCPTAEAQPRAATVTRWKGGARSAFGWRGDQDLYDPATLQDAAGLRMALGLARRFWLPCTLYLSARLSLVPEEHRKFCEHFGWNRRTEEIPDFIRFLREDVHIQAEMEWPFRSERLYFMEVGNHMFHHYGTHASAAEGNDWKRSSIGDGKYEWELDGKTDDFSEQRSNAAKCNEVFKNVLDLVPMSFAVPGRDYSGNTAAAVEAAGIRVGSDSDASQWHNVMELPRPHHPKGVRQLVDVTKKYPGDCDNAYRIVMLQYWMHRAQREGSHFLYMAHQHMLRYFNNACYHLSEEMFRYVLGDCHGDFWVGTVSAIAMYWEKVLCPEHREVAASVQDGVVTVRNTGSSHLDQVPVEVTFASGRSYMALVDLPPGQTVTVS